MYNTEQAVKPSGLFEHTSFFENDGQREIIFAIIILTGLCINVVASTFIISFIYNEMRQRSVFILTPPQLVERGALGVERYDFLLRKM